ncbi:MAG: transglycosylase SLT domain-containing protein [Candidatus Saccharimonadaceae bacterium]
MAQPSPEPAQAPQGCDTVQSYSWDVATARAICMAESGGDSTADNTGLNSDGSNDKGLMQINSIHTPQLIGDTERFDPAQNVKAAYAIYKGAEKRSGNGWTAWSSYNSGKYVKYLK